MSLATQPAPNFEEATFVTSEFVTSLDNLPNEVQHLLQEIKLKDQRCQELQQDIAKDQQRYIKSALRQGTVGSVPSLNIHGVESDTTSPTSATLSPSSNPKAHLPARISAAYMEIDTLADEKVEIAHRIIQLLMRTRARLDADLAKVRTLQGEPAENIHASYIHSTNQLRSASPQGIKRHGSKIGLASVIQIGESLRSAMSGAQPDNIISVPVGSGSSYNKKRRLNTSSPAPTALNHTTLPHSRSRLSRQSQVVRVQHQEEEDLDADAEGDEDPNGEDVEDDLTLYCFCHKQSYGDMIGCDNPDCPYQWFHITCVGVKTPLPDKWYCPECTKTKSTAPERRKGRKK